MKLSGSAASKLLPSALLRSRLKCPGGGEGFVPLGGRLAQNNLAETVGVQNTNLCLFKVDTNKLKEAENNMFERTIDDIHPRDKLRDSTRMRFWHLRMFGYVCQDTRCAADTGHRVKDSQ